MSKYELNQYSEINARKLPLFAAMLAGIALCSFTLGKASADIAWKNMVRDVFEVAVKFEPEFGNSTHDGRIPMKTIIMPYKNQWWIYRYADIDYVTKNDLLFDGDSILVIENDKDMHRKYFYKRAFSSFFGEEFFCPSPHIFFNQNGDRIPCIELPYSGLWFNPGFHESNMRFLQENVLRPCFGEGKVMYSENDTCMK